MAQPKPAPKAYVPPGGVSGASAGQQAKTIGGAGGGAQSAQL